MQILHLSADFPDPFAPGKTRAIANLLDLVHDADHRVYSLNRVDRGSDILAHDFAGQHRAVAYGAPPRGLFMAQRLGRVADWILCDLDRRGLRPDVVHAHKLSVEGLVGDLIARVLGVPLIVSSQGNSDLRILSARRDLLRRWRRIWQEAAVVLPFAPWTGDALWRLLGPRAGPVTCLPCPTPADSVLPPRPVPDRILSVFRLDQFANKNAACLMAAVDIVRLHRPNVELVFAGGGSAADTSRIAALIGSRPHVRLAGPVPGEAIQAMMNDSALMAVPSRRESYGMVFAEALLAGCPVLHGRGNGPSGYFNAPWARAMPQGGACELAAVLTDMLDGQVRLKRALQDAQSNGALDRLRRPAIAATYRDALTVALGTPSAAAA